MVSLIIVIISIALVSALAAASISHVPASALLRQVLFKETQTGVRMLQGAAARYFETHRDPEGIVIYPGTNVDMAPLVSPAYGFMPANVRNVFTWETRTGFLFGYPAAYICVKPVLPTVEGKEVLELIKATLPGQAARLGNTCGATDDNANGTHLTVWMILAHYNGSSLAQGGAPADMPDAGGVELAE